MTLIWANRAYAILRHELANVGVNNPGPKALDMLSLGNPDLDWVSLAKAWASEQGGSIRSTSWSVLSAPE
jgi:acetolactate synthase-1/2/3 large subunit